MAFLPLSDHLRQRFNQQLSLADALYRIKTIVTKEIPELSISVRSLSGGTVTLEVSSSVAAAELRLRSADLQEKINLSIAPRRVHLIRIFVRG